MLLQSWYVVCFDADLFCRAFRWFCQSAESDLGDTEIAATSWMAAMIVAAMLMTVVFAPFRAATEVRQKCLKFVLVSGDFLTWKTALHLG